MNLPLLFLDMKLTPEENARVARRTLCITAKALCLTARGNGVTDDRIKSLVLSMRSLELAILTDDEALDLVTQLELQGA